MNAPYCFIFLVIAALVSPSMVAAASYYEGGDATPVSTSFNILGLGQAIGRTSVSPNDTSEFVGTGSLSNTILAYTMEQEISNILGVTNVTLEGEVDITSGAGFDIVRDCSGVDVICNSMTFDTPFPFLADFIFQDLDAGTIFWTDSLVVDTELIGLIDIDISFAATEFGRTAVAPLALPTPVPVPLAAWLFGSSLIGLAGAKLKNRMLTRNG